MLALPSNGKSTDEVERVLDKMFAELPKPGNVTPGEATWAELRQVLERYGLLGIEQHPYQETPFLPFHPVLLSFSRQDINEEQYEYLMKKYQRRILQTV